MASGQGEMQGGAGDVQVEHRDEPGATSLQRGERMGGLAVPATPFNAISQMFDEIDRLFDAFGFGPSRMLPASPTQTRAGSSLKAFWSPQIEIAERDGKLRVCADLPGMRKEDLHVGIEKDTLTIQGERSESREENERFYRSERHYGSFHRSIPLPDGTDAGQVEARFTDGVLEITVPLPKRSEPQRRRIEVR